MSGKIGSTLNGEAVAAPGAMPLLYALRGPPGRKGSRVGCGEGQCGACTVTLDGVSVPFCGQPLSSIAGCAIRRANISRLLKKSVMRDGFPLLALAGLGVRALGAEGMPA